MNTFSALAAAAVAVVAGALPSVIPSAHAGSVSGPHAHTVLSPPSKVAGDIDGDGKSDLVIGEDSAITVVYTSATPGGSHTQKIELPAGSLEYASAYGVQNIAVGDFNGDGYADVAAGAPTAHHGDGEVFVWSGGPNGIVPSHVVTLHGPKGKKDGFGASVLAGDLNRGADQDLLVADITGVDGRTDHAVTELFGRPHGLSTTHEKVLNIPNLVAAAIGDVNADGRPDLVYAQSAPRKVTVLLGTSHGLSTAHKHPVTGVHALKGQEVTQLAIDKVTGSKHPVVLLGLPLTSVAGVHGAGKVLVLSGDKAGISSSHPKVISQATPGVPGAPTHNADFGAVVTLADLNGDGHLDLITATDPAVKHPVGAIFKIGGTSHGFTGSGAQTVDEASSGLPTPSEPAPHYFGAAITSFRPTGGSSAAVAVGVPGADVVDVFQGSIQGLTSGASQLTGGPNNDFGESLAH